MTRYSRIRRVAKKTAIAVGCLIVVAFLTFPYTARILDLPSGRSFENAHRQMLLLSKAIGLYTQDYNGAVPPSFAQLRQYAMKLSEYEELDIELSEERFQYFPHAADGQPVLCCYLPYETRSDVLIWVDRKGRIHKSLVWLWPKWRN